MMTQKLRKTRSIRFRPRQDFTKTLNRRVEGYFLENEISKSDSPSLYLKCAILFLSLSVCWSLLVFGDLPIWAAVVAIAGIGLSVAGIGFNVMHDGGHRSFSKHKSINKIMAYSSDLVGASSYFWAIKHNQFHHTYTNINGYDDDINLGVLGRLSHDQPRLGFHRFQHLYIWFLYTFLNVKWNFYDDYICLIRSKIGEQPIQRPRGFDLFGFTAGKVFFYTWALIIPMTIHPFWAVVGIYYLASAIAGITLAIVFQLAHMIEEASFPVLEPTSNRISEEWTIHQIQTTVNFAPKNAFVCWYVGGLNFQIEHHLFPHISHVHYPSIAKIVQDTCSEYGIDYQCHESILSGIRSHYRKLLLLGKPEPVKLKQAA